MVIINYAPIAGMLLCNVILVKSYNAHYMSVCLFVFR